jgi:hypothetical protein
MDVRALGCLLEELVACSEGDERAAAAMKALAEACVHGDVDRRPKAEDVARSLHDGLGR